MAKSRPRFPKSSDAQRYATLLLVFFLGALFSILGFKLVQNEEQARLAALFEQRGQDIVNRFQRGIGHGLTILEFLGGFYDSVQKVGSVEFRSLVVGLLPQDPEIQMLAWASRFRNSRQARDFGLPDKAFASSAIQPAPINSSGIWSDWEAAVEAALQLEAMGQRGDLTRAWETYTLLEEAIADLKPFLVALGREIHP